MKWIESGVRGNSSKPPEWLEVPCVTVGKTGVTFNKKFCEAYGVSHGSRLMIGYDRENFKIGFRTPRDGEAGHLVVPSGGNKGSIGTSFKLAGKSIANVFPDRIGRTYRATLNPEQRVIEVDLTEELKKF